jgi:cytochrome c oxidase assembly protein subunit 15
MAHRSKEATPTTLPYSKPANGLAMYKAAIAAIDIDKDHPNRADRRSVAIWLFICCGLVLLMVVVGGVTRLTQSGLSIVEWQPIIGTVPPLNKSQWAAAFQSYQQTPQYQQVNEGMSLAAFKRIFWWEYFHRLAARGVGLAFLLPFLYYLAHGTIRGVLAWKLAGIFVLGAMQGALGWYMVKSGLVDNPRVSQLRLTAHLGIAFLILAALLWTALDIVRPRRGEPSAQRRRLARQALALCALVFLMVLSGGLVAGIRAGFAYNTFPLMNGSFVPSEILLLEPWWKNLFYNMATVQFVHRSFAWLLIVLIPLFWFASRRIELRREARIATAAMPAMLAIQVTLGIATLLMKVPVPLAAAHQAGGVLLFSASLWASHALRSK